MAKRSFSLKNLGRKYTKPLRRVEVFDEDTARQLSVVTALIAYVQLKILDQKNRIAVPLKRVSVLAKNHILDLRDLSQFIKPPDRSNRPTPEIGSLSIFPDSSGRWYERHRRLPDPVARRVSV